MGLFFFRLKSQGFGRHCEETNFDNYYFSVQFTGYVLVIWSIFSLQSFRVIEAGKAMEFVNVLGYWR